MKNRTRLVVALAMALALVIVSVPGQAFASAIELSNGVASGSWEWTSSVGGHEIPMNTISLTKPEWGTLLTNGLYLTSPAKICHTFDGYQYGWSGDIYMLSGETWTMLTTSVDWVPTFEGKIMACAEAPSAGTYALFGYWIKPAGWQSIEVSPTCKSSINIRESYRMQNLR